MKYGTGQYDRVMQIDALPADRQATAELNAYREEVEDWQPVATRWVRVEALSGRELNRAQQTDAAITHQLNFRHWPGLTTRHRLRMGRRIFNLLAVIDLGDEHYEHECQAVEVQLKPGETT